MARSRGVANSDILNPSSVSLRTNSIGGGMGIAHLGRAARTLREERGIEQWRVGAAANRGSDAVGKFEQGKTFQTLDEFVQAYAEELGVEPIDIWRAACRLMDEEAKSTNNKR